MSISRSDGSKKSKTITVKACPSFNKIGSKHYSDLTLSIQNGILAKGTFGVIYKAQILQVNSMQEVVIKKIYQDSRYKNRELQIMYKLEEHQNIVKMLHHFFSKGNKSDIYLNLVLEYFPESLDVLLLRYINDNNSLPSILQVKAYLYQLLRGLSYMHNLCICHRDIKTCNLLVNEEELVLKICDFGSAKEIKSDETNVAYMSSRYYRAPELLFGSTKYSCSIDLWSAGCVLGELLTGKYLFVGETSIDQLVTIIKFLGTPNKSDIEAMNPVYNKFNFPQVKPANFIHITTDVNPDSLDLLCQLLIYNPKKRINPFVALSHPFFDELRQPMFVDLLPHLFSFSDLEFTVEPTLKSILVPQNFKMTPKNSGNRVE